MSYQPIYDIAELCYRKGLTQAVLCPGSRCAPLTLAFSRHSKITARTFSDERSAGFIALGMAQQSKTPVIMVCTSGSAAYNFAPAIAEAFFAQTPLLVFTADRPAEWIAQYDGQTIHQQEIFGKHVKKYFQLPQTYDHTDDQWAINRIVNEAVNLARQEPQGPVHINAPFREPLYPELNTIEFSTDIRVLEDVPAQHALSSETLDQLKIEWKKYNKVLVVAGQQDLNALLTSTLEKFSTTHAIPVVADIISNQHTVRQGIAHADVFLAHAPGPVKKSLQPDLLITFGKSVISKNLKIFLRKFGPRAHWHLQPAGAVADPLQHVTKVLPVTPENFFSSMTEANNTHDSKNQKQHTYQKLWEIEEKRVTLSLSDFFPQEKAGELEFVQKILSLIPSESNLHLANSMSVRYANIIGLNPDQKVTVRANRGTSGIDGCTSTAVGHALLDKKTNILITGDLAFFYDRNAFWHNYPVPNLRIVVLNNHGGIIFKMIDGPSSLPEAEEYFITQQKLNARKLCEEYGFEYLLIDTLQNIKNTLNDFFVMDGRTKILELESSIELNKNIFEALKQKIKKSYEL